MRKTAVWMLLPLLLASLPPRPRALEVSLEENRAQRGSIGYVDLQRVFQRFPETQKAKQSFQEIIRQAEDQVNLRKAEVFAVRSEISKLEIELDLLKKTPIFVPEQQGAEAPAVQASSAAVSTAAAPGAAAPPAPALSTASLQSLTLNLPGMTTGPVAIAPPAQSAQAPAAAAVSISSAPTRPEDEQQAAESRRQARAKAQAAELATAAARARDERLREIQDAISAKRKDLAAKEEAYKKYQAQVENNLLELEGRRTEILLGKIYSIIQEVAHENGVGVVIDKSQILFGQRTVDLTDKVIKKMEGM